MFPMPMTVPPCALNHDRIRPQAAVRDDRREIVDVDDVVDFRVSGNGHGQATASALSESRSPVISSHRLRRGLRLRFFDGFSLDDFGEIRRSGANIEFAGDHFGD